MIDEPVIISRVIDLYQKGDFSTAYDLITNEGEISSQWMSRVFEIRMDLAAVMGRLDLAEDILAQSLEHGYYYNEKILREDQDVKVLQGRPRFETLVSNSLEKLECARMHAKPELCILEPAELPDSPLPLLVGLHGNNSNANIYAQNWGFLSDANWLVALPQSSQVCAKGLYVWNDLYRTERELVAHYSCLSRCYRIDPNRIILNGFSKGGYIALQAAFKQHIPARGYLGLAPYFADPAVILPLLKRMQQPTPRCYFILGEQDVKCTPHALKTIELLRSYAIECEVEVVPGLAHEIPQGFATLVRRAIRFILDE